MCLTLSITKGAWTYHTVFVMCSVLQYVQWVMCSVLCEVLTLYNLNYCEQCGCFSLHYQSWMHFLASSDLTVCICCMCAWIVLFFLIVVLCVQSHKKSLILVFMWHKILSSLSSLEVHNLDLYKKMVAFVMSYSFTEPSNRLPIGMDADEDDEDDDDNDSHHPPPVMVPLADALNHIAKNNAKLLFEKECLKMVSTKPIRKVRLLSMYLVDDLCHS